MIKYLHTPSAICWRHNCWQSGHWGDNNFTRYYYSEFIFRMYRSTMVHLARSRNWSLDV